MVATALTNVDIHDMARSGRTFSLRGVYVVTPVVLQQRMVEEVLSHWTQGQGAQHERRAEAMGRVSVVASLEEAQADIARRTGCAPEVAVTGARMESTVGYDELRATLPNRIKPLLLVFGTGWGLTPQVVDQADLRLPPIACDPAFEGKEPRYNHLSVRAAIAIVLDRLLGNR